MASTSLLALGQQADMDARAPAALVGRSHERRALDRTLERLRGGQGSALVLHGEPGIGKTALLRYMQDRAIGCQVVTASAVPTEMQLAFAGLHQMCVPLLDRIERLPAHQRGTLATAFGLTAGTPPAHLRLGPAVLDLLTEVADERPVLCLVDDAQWLDEASSQVLSFVARRLTAERVALVVATREPLTWPAGVPDLRVQGLCDRDARALLFSVVRGPLDAHVAECVIAETNGNPRALLESAHASTATMTGFRDPQAGRTTSEVDRRVAARLALLPDDTRLFLHLAAAEPLGDAPLLWRAAQRLGIPADAIEEARNAGLCDIGSRVRFRPMVRSAVYRSAAPVNLRRAHGALADATDPQVAAERHVWHRAQAACMPDADIAAQLERSAAEAGTRSGPSAKSNVLLKAAALTPHPLERGRRMLSAAEADWQAGDPTAVLRAVVSAEAGPLDQLGRAHAELLRARLAFVSGDADAARRLFDAARRLEPLDIGMARHAHLDALGATILLSPTAGCEPIDVARSALTLERAAAPRLLDLLLDGIARQASDGYAAATPALARAVTGLLGEESSAATGLASGWLASRVAGLLMQHDLQKDLARRHLRVVRDAGAVAVLTELVAQLVEIDLREGNLAAADARMREPEVACDQRLRESTALVAAYRGREEEGRRMINEARQHRGSDPWGVGASVVEFADIFLNIGLGRYEDALRRGRRAREDLERLGEAPWVLPDLVEAAARSGAADIATAALRRLTQSARVSGTEWALGLEARSRALLSDGSAADHLYREAIAHLKRTGCRVDLSRAHLLYGEWLRRAGRRVDARAHLRTADDMLSEMGIEAFAERARRELRATAETARKRVVETRDDLTPQEKEIARLARDGLSNPEIGARLFLSRRTVEWHLRKIFVKLGITSRFCLREALPGDACRADQVGS